MAVTTWMPLSKFTMNVELAFLEDVRGFRVKRLTNEEADKLSDEELLAFVS